LGAALIKNGEYEDAIAALERAISLDPYDSLAHYNLAVALHRNQQYEEAISEYQQAILLNPKLSLAFYNMGIALQQVGRGQEAVSFLLEARNLFIEEGNLEKIDAVDQYLTQLNISSNPLPNSFQPMPAITEEP